MSRGRAREQERPLAMAALRRLFLRLEITRQAIKNSALRKCARSMYCMWAVQAGDCSLIIRIKAASGRGPGFGPKGLSLDEKESAKLYSG
jgi:hypothetical protein